VSIETPDGEVVESDRFMVAICTCRRSKIYPMCDTSHRRCRPAAQANSAKRSS
jgi:CDGSH-type Zn-finger protein